MNFILYSSDNRREILFKTYVERMRYSVSSHNNWEIFKCLMSIYEFNVVVLDLPSFNDNKQQQDMLAECRKAAHDATILVLCEYGDLNTRFLALELGADDCLSGYPEFSRFEIILKAIVRRSGVEREVSGSGLIALDKTSHSVRIDGRVVKLTPKEYKLLHLLIKRQGGIVSKETILKNLFDLEEFADTNLIHPHVSRLRNKIRHDAICIKADYGIGYRLDIDHTALKETSECK